MQDRARTETDAANAALGELGEPTIADIADPSDVRARECRRHFGGARDETLRENFWNFATGWDAPALADSLGIGEFANRYPLRPDCIMVRFVKNAVDDDWDIESATYVDGTGATIEAMVLVTNRTAPVVCYTRRVTDVALWDPMFVAAFAKRLAAKIAPAIARNRGWAAALEEGAIEKSDRAAAIDARENAPKQVSRDTSWIAARRGLRPSGRGW